MEHFTSRRFWTAYQALPAGIRDVADKNYQLLKTNPKHPSLHFKKAGSYWSVRVGEGYRALGVESEGDIIWIWVGTHSEYNHKIRL